MKKGIEFGGGRADADTNVDIIELELKPEELRALTGAAEHNIPRSTIADPTPGLARGSKSPNILLDSRVRIALLLCISVAVAAVLFAAGRTRVVAPRSPHVDSVVASATPIARPVPLPTEPPVRFANPFDPTEVFEFAAGTSARDARDAVAKILTERARERLAMITTKRPRRNRSVSPSPTATQSADRLSMGSDSLPIL